MNGSGTGVVLFCKMHWGDDGRERLYDVCMLFYDRACFFPSKQN